MFNLIFMHIQILVDKKTTPLIWDLKPKLYRNKLATYTHLLVFLLKSLPLIFFVNSLILKDKRPWLSRVWSRIVQFVFY